ncbi:probable flap endonuclease 1 homolog [Mugil cephalus]|uniref:probable flap endonuclease 1 homolog n=1 Tax=Mugil cephalus TaxID=48193 RepID=UPI001FB57EAB|nr:probable flap endonuclease 1 homolog [Mugil cephalus]
MGITKLADLIRSHAPDAISHKNISDYTGKIIALDTSIVMNQFRAATPMVSPLTGLFFRTLTFLEHDIKPVFVFDGKPPEEKSAVLEKRAEALCWKSPNRTGTASTQTRNCQQLLKHMGVPIIQAPGDAEALCARLVREGTVDAVASEDMDTLPFGATTLIRQLNAKKDSEIVEYSLPKLLKTLKIKHKGFVDLCILLGCDYCDKIPGLGPKRALTLIQKHRTIENVVLYVNRKNHPIPMSWRYEQARKIFLDSQQTQAPELVWSEPDEQALVTFLRQAAHAKEERVLNRMKKFLETRQNKREEREKEKAAGSHKQTVMEDFFRVTRKRGKPVEVTDTSSSNKKRPKTK